MISVEGRTHPVSTHFLEDVYEKMEYCLALDSPASGAYFAQHGEKVSYSQFLHLIVLHILDLLEPCDYYCFGSKKRLTVSFGWLDLYVFLFLIVVADIGLF